MGESSLFLLRPDELEFAEPALTHGGDGLSRRVGLPRQPLSGEMFEWPKVKLLPKF